MSTVTGPKSSVVGHIATWANSTGTLIADSGVVPIGWFNVLNYGADNTGATDSTNAVRAAIAAVPNGVNGVTGGIVYFPAGTYNLAAISISTSNITLLGDGVFATTLIPSSTTGNFITISGGRSTVSSLSVYSNSVKRTSGDTIYINAGGVSVTNIQMECTSPGGFYNGLHFDGANAAEFYLNNFLIGQCSNAAIQIGDSSSTSQAVGGYIANGNIGSCGNGILIYDCGGMNVSDVGIIESTSHGVITFPSSGQNSFALYFTNVLCDTCGSDGWLISANGGNVGDVNLIGCWGSSNSGSGVNLAGGQNANTQVLTNSSVNGVSIIGGNYINNRQNGILLSSCTNVVINGAQVYNNSQAARGASNGIAVASGVSGFQIVNCVSGNGGYTQQAGFPAQQGYGILISSGPSSNYIIQSNRFPGNISGGLIDAGTGTAKLVGSNLNS